MGNAETMYQNILYPTDGSDIAEKALSHVRDLAEKYDASVHILYVVESHKAAVGIGNDPTADDSPSTNGESDGAASPMVQTGGNDREIREQERNYGVGVVEQAARQLSFVETPVAVRGGEPPQTIVDYACEEDIDMIVMGTKDRSGLLRFLLSSVTEQVVRLSEIPVVTVPETPVPDIDI